MTATSESPNIRQRIEERMARARERRRKAALTWLGLAGLTYDAGISFLERAKQLRDKAEARGEQVQEDANVHISALKDKVAGTMEERRRRCRQRVERIVPSKTEGGQDNGESVEIDVEFVAEAPWPGYDDLNVQQVVERLQALEQHDLRSLRAYEVAHKNRVSVLREINRLLTEPVQA